MQHQFVKVLNFVQCMKCVIISYIDETGCSQVSARLPLGLINDTICIGGYEGDVKSIMMAMVKAILGVTGKISCIAVISTSLFGCSMLERNWSQILLTRRGLRDMVRVSQSS